MSNHQKYDLQPIGDFVLHPRNPRRGDIGAIAESIERNGWYGAVITQKSTGYVIAGNHRVMAARQLGFTSLPTFELDVDDATALRIMLADNRSSDRASNDEGILAQLLQEIAAEQGDLAGTLYDGDDLDQLLRDIAGQGAVPAGADDVPEPPAEPVTKLGDVIELGAHRLICGDATSGEAWASALDGESAALVFTSPPYLDAREYSGAVDLDAAHLAGFINHAADHSDLICVNLGLIRRENAIVPFWDLYLERASAAGLRLLSWNIWDRNQPCSIGQNTAMFPIEHEFVFVFGERRRLHRTVRNKTPGTRTGITNRQTDGSLRAAVPKQVHEYRPLGTVFRSSPHIGADIGHPAMFPVALPAAYIEACTKRGDVVIDPFGGSGSTLIACEQTGRRCVMIEIDPAYCDVIRARYAKFTTASHPTPT